MFAQQHQNAEKLEQTSLELEILKRSRQQTTRQQTTYRSAAMVLMLATCLIASACQPSPPASQVSPPSSGSSASTSPDPTSGSEATSNQYADQTLGIRFAYPTDFVMDNLQSDATQTEPTAIETLELWHQEKFEAIAAGEYEGGTELPPNVQVAVYPNPDRLSLSDWVASQNQQFVQPRNLQARSIAGQEALEFASTGLYEHENVVLPSQSGNEVILISLATVGVPEVDEPNQRAFNQVLATLELR